MEALHGSQLNAVVFVQNYLQLQFDGRVLTIYQFPPVRRGLESYSIERPGYRDELCAFIGNILVTTSHEQSVLELSFQSGDRISISCREEDSTSPEVANLDLNNGAIYVWHPE